MTTAAVSGDPPEVYLGAAGELATSSSDQSASFHESRAGGRAWAPSSASMSHAVADVDARPPRGVSLPPRCGCCGSATALVMQIHAPLLPSLPDRALLFFACVRGGEECSRRSDSWVGVRVQGPRAEAEAATTPAVTPTLAPPAPLPVASAAAPSDSWGLESDGGGWGIEGGDEGDQNEEKIDFSELATELAAAAGDLRERQKQNGKAKAREKSSKEEGSARRVSAKEAPPRHLLWTQPAGAGPTLPSFFVSWSLEADAEAKSKKKSSSSSDKKKKDEDDEDAHVAELLARYEASEGRGNLPPTAATAPSSSSTDRDDALASSRAAESVGWSGEGYEPDSAPGASPAFLAFAKRLSRSPEQVARYYSRSGGSARPSVPPQPRLLWPEEEGPPQPPPPCPRCGSQRQYEAQLMAPLVALIDEAGQWEEEDEVGGEGGEGGLRKRRREGAPALRRAPESWEWLTVAMATCLEGCGGGEGDGVFAVEEAVAVAFE